MKLCAGMQKREPDAVMMTEGFINALGARLLQLNRSQDAIAMLPMNTEGHPRSAEACGQLADAYLKSGDAARANQFHRKALEIDPKLASSIEALKKLSHEDKDSVK